ncbi:MAG: hypothetical protein KC535_00685 [Nanoarchaeota archaeon]|nr:hypothetical protein [Nanoarchaeota archaeon]
MRMNTKKLFLISLLAIMLVLTSCSGIPFSRTSSKSQTGNYYQGTDGVIMRFSDATTPPSRMYYYEGGSIDDNAFQVMVDVHNIGASWTKGALYVSGYDPYMINFDEIDIQKGSAWSDCTFDISSFLNGGFASANCAGVSLSGGTDGRFEISTRDLGHIFGWDDSILSGLGLTVSSTGSGSYSVNANLDSLIDADVYNLGRGLIIAMSGLSLTQYNGLNYNGLQTGAGILAPDGPDFPGGEMNTVVFNGEVDNWPQGLDQTDKPITFLVTNCFLYTTYATPQVCIDPAPYDQGVKVCTPRPTTFNGGNGAPVAITSIEQENTRTKVLFEINIQNVGGGTVMDLGSMERCSPYYPGRLTTQDLNNVYIIDARIGGQHLDCTPDRWDPIKLVNGQATARCEYNMEYATAKSAYETPLIIELGYGYSTTMKRSTTIKRVI